MPALMIALGIVPVFFSGYCACEDCYVLVCNYDYTDVRFVGWPYDPWEEIVSCALMIDIRMGL